MTSYIKLIDGAVGGFVPAQHRLRISIYLPHAPAASAAAAPGHLHVETLTDPAAETYATTVHRTDVPRAACTQLLDDVARALAALPPGLGGDDVYGADAHVTVARGLGDDGKGDGAGHLQRLATEWYRLNADAQVFGAQAEAAGEGAFLWQNLVPQACSTSGNWEDEPGIGAEQKREFRQVMARIVQFAREHANENGRASVPAPRALAGGSWGL